MSHSKGPRQRVVLRLPVALVEDLKAQRDTRGLDGLPDLIEERLSLRQDRDAEVAELKAALGAERALRLEMARRARSWEKRARKAEARRGRKTATVDLAGFTAVDLAYLRDHRAGDHAGGALAGLCPACPEAAANRANSTNHV